MSLTDEQTRALDALFPPKPAGALETWLGLAPGQASAIVQRLLEGKDAVIDIALQHAERRPLESMVTFVAASALAFQRAEQGANPRVTSYIDAFYYISTCISVGYADIFAVTPQGKSIAALAMMVGPALAAKALDKRAA
jgi:hypothetical protein